MPFYEYECSACKFYVEALQKVSDPPMKKCPSCKKATLKKLVSAPVFRLKGSGWYETDFKSEQEQKRNLVGEDKETPESKPDTPADKSDKPEKSAEPKPAKAAVGKPKKKPAKLAAKPKPRPKAKAAAKKK